MNKERRKRIDDVILRIEKLGPAIEPLLTEAQLIADEIESIRDDEQEAHENLPDSMRDGERGDEMEYAISQLEEVLEPLEALGAAEFNHESAVQALDEAKQ